MLYANVSVRFCTPLENEMLSMFKQQENENASLPEGICMSEEVSEASGSSESLHSHIYLRTRLLSLLSETSEKCEKNSVSVDSQERYAMVAEVPRVVENRGKANIAFKKISEDLNKSNSVEELLFFLGGELVKQRGLFFRIFRGKINKYIIPEFDAELQTKLRYSV